MTRALITGTIGSSVPAMIECGLPNDGQRKQACPRCRGEKLVQVSDRRAVRPLAFEHPHNGRGVSAGATTVKISSDPGRVVVIQEPPRRQQFRQHCGSAGHRPDAKTSRRQNQPPAAARVPDGELLGEATPTTTQARRSPQRRGPESPTTGQASPRDTKSYQGRIEIEDQPAPGTSKRTTVVLGSSCSTSGSSTSKLAPMPLHNTSGTPDPARTLTRIC